MKNQFNLEDNHKKRKIKSSLSSYAKYSGLSFQMIAIVLVFVFGGLKLDKYLNWKFPVFTLFFSLLGVVIAMYVAIKDFLGNK
ncbi:MAG: AtpZ/AtpI family protein [Bacteroidales bacterium]